MQNTIIRILTKIHNHKKVNNIFPNNPLFKEVMLELRTTLLSELESMESEGVITIGNTINDKYIKLKR